MFEVNELIDERSYQQQFYSTVFGNDFDRNEIIKFGHNTDGYTKTILFEHKKNVRTNGLSKTLGQALLYLVKFNKAGIPVPGTIMLVSQNEALIYIYKTARYSNIINNINEHGGLIASGSIKDIYLTNTEPDEIFEYNLTSSIGISKIKEKIESYIDYCKVNITIDNVVAWSHMFYEEMIKLKKKNLKSLFFRTIKNPEGFMEELINPWTGTEKDFSSVMDQLNDPALQKHNGAFYTPKLYAEKAFEMLKHQIEEFKQKYPDDDYLIIDRCAGSGNLEEVMDNESLSHCILNSYELKEWIVLRDKYNRHVRMLIPHAPENGDDPINDGSNIPEGDALSKIFCDKLKKAIKECRTTEHCGIFFFENPPYAEPQAIANQRYNYTNEEEEVVEHEDGCDANTPWKHSYVINEMKKEISGVATNDMANLFIWSAFNMFMENEDDGYVVFAPIKYWKVQHMISKKFVDGFLANRKHFHANSAAAISVISWKNTISTETSFKLNVYDIEKNMIKWLPPVDCKQINRQISESYFDKRKLNNEIATVVCDSNGFEYTKDKSRTVGRTGDDVVGYMLSTSSTVEQPALTNQLLTCISYAGCGYYLRKDNMIEKFPIFAAGYYGSLSKKWWVNAFRNKTGDGVDKFNAAVKSGSIDDWLIRCMLWTCLTRDNHMCSFVGSDGVKYINKLALCQDTLADELLIKYNYTYNEDEEVMINIWKEILKAIKNTDEYNSEFKYNLYQIDTEINIKIETGERSSDGTPVMRKKYDKLDGLISMLKDLTKKYYFDYLEKNLLKYKFIK